MTETEYAEHVADQRALARQRLDDLLYDLRCTLWPRTPWHIGPADPIEWEDERRAHMAAIRTRFAILTTPILAPDRAHTLIAGAFT